MGGGIIPIPAVIRGQTEELAEKEKDESSQIVPGLDMRAVLDRRLGRLRGEPDPVGGGLTGRDRISQRIFGIKHGDKTPEEILQLVAPGLPTALLGIDPQRPDAADTAINRPHAVLSPGDAGPGPIDIVKGFAEGLATMAFDGAKVTKAGFLDLMEAAAMGQTEEAIRNSGGVFSPADVEEALAAVDKMREERGFTPRLDRLTPAQKKNFVAIVASLAVGSLGAYGLKTLTTPSVMGLGRGGSIGLALDAMPHAAKGLLFQSLPAGVTFGALRESENTFNAIITDFLLFGGLHLGFSAFGRGTRPIELPPHVDPKITFKQWSQRLNAAFSRDRKFPHSTDPLTLLDSEIRAVRHRAVIQSQAVDGVMRDIQLLADELKWKNDGKMVTFGDQSVMVAERASELSPYGGWGSPSRIGERLASQGAAVVEGAAGPKASVQTIAGSMFNRLVTNGIDRSHLQTRIATEWGPVRKQIKDELFRGTATSGPIVGRKAKGEALFKHFRLMDDVFQPSELPPGLPENFKNAFATHRLYLEQTRTTLEFLTGKEVGPLSFGMDGYITHAHIGDWLIENVKTGGNLAVTSWSGAKGALQRVAGENPGVELRMVPRFSKTQMTPELQALGVNGQAFGEWLSSMEAGLKMDAADIAAFVSGAKMPYRPAGKKSFGFMLERSANLPDFLTDPLKATDIYVQGLARKVAYHDFAQKAEMIFSQIEKMGFSRKGNTLKVGQAYVDRVMGVPGSFETWSGDVMRKVAEKSPEMFQPILEKNLNPRRISRMISFGMYMSKLGWSAPAIYAQLSQTVINTATQIGYRPVIRAMRAMATKDPAKQARIRQLIAEMEPELMMPLGADMMAPVLKTVPWWYPTYWFNKGDSVNRVVSGLSKYMDDLSKGVDERQAMQNARVHIRENQFEYSMADAPPITAGPINQVLFQFKKFLIKELEFVWQGATRGTPGQRTAFLARFAANTTAMGGIGVIMDLPPLALVDFVSGLSGEQITERVRRQAPEKLGALGTVLAHGLPGLVAGVDVSQTVSIGMPSDVGGVFGPFPNDILAIARSSFPEVLRRVVLAKNGELTPTERDLVVRQWLPVFVRRLVVASKIAEDGKVRTTSGTLRFIADDRNREAAGMALGFQSITSVGERDAFRSNARIQRQHLKAEKVFVDDISRAILERDQNKMMRLYAESRKRGLFLSEQQIQAAVARLNFDRTTRQALRAPPELRPTIIRKAPAGTTFNP